MATIWVNKNRDATYHAATGVYSTAMCGVKPPATKGWTSVKKQKPTYCVCKECEKAVGDA